MTLSIYVYIYIYINTYIYIYIYISTFIYIYIYVKCSDDLKDPCRLQHGPEHGPLHYGTACSYMVESVHAAVVMLWQPCSTIMFHNEQSMGQLQDIICSGRFVVTCDVAQQSHTCNHVIMEPCGTSHNKYI